MHVHVSTDTGNLSLFLYSSPHLTVSVCFPFKSLYTGWSLSSSISIAVPGFSKKSLLAWLMSFSWSLTYTYGYNTHTHDRKCTNQAGDGEGCLLFRGMVYVTFAWLLLCGLRVFTVHLCLPLSTSLFLSLMQNLLVCLYIAALSGCACIHS